MAAFLIAACLSGCIPRSDRPIAASDLVFGRLPADETVLRVKVPCSTAQPGNDRGPVFDLPVGDYRPITADSDGIFYGGVPMGGWGIYFPLEVRPNSPPRFWTQVLNLEWGRVRSEKEWVLPERCWKPYGSTMVIVHKGAEIPLR